jgi:chemotaxis protein CheC
MRLNVDTLGTFYEMARQGAGLAADRLTELSGVESRVADTRIEFTTAEAVRSRLATADDRAGTVVDLSGGLDGETLLVFDADSARSVAATLVEAVDDRRVDRPVEELVDSAVPEFCAIVNNGFVDGWANVLDREVELSAPRYVSGEALPDAVEAGGVDGVAVLFRSRIETDAAGLSLDHYFLPGAATTELFAAEEGIAYESLVGFDRVAQRGADRVTGDLSKLTGIETTIDVRRVSFVALDAIPAAVPNEALASVAFSFTGTPSGYLLFLYDGYSARRLARTMTGSAPDSGLDEMGRDAVKEASNIMASGLLDGWANALETSIEHSTPAFTWDLGPAAVDPLVIALSRRQEFAFVFDTRIEADDRSFDVSIYVIPEESDLVRAVDAVDPDRAERASAAADVDVGDLDDSELADVDEVEGVSVE